MLSIISPMGFWNSKLLTHTRIIGLNLEKQIILQPCVLKWEQFDVSVIYTVQKGTVSLLNMLLILAQIQCH